LKDEGYVHLKVNHSINFVDPETGANTNKIESSWRAAKAVTSGSSRRKEHIPGNLARYMFNKSCASQNLNRTDHFLRLAETLYDPNRPEEEENEEDGEDLTEEMMDFPLDS